MMAVITGHAIIDGRMYHSGYIIDGNYVGILDPYFANAFSLSVDNEELTTHCVWDFCFLGKAALDYRELDPQTIPYRDWSRNHAKNQEAEDMVESLLSAFRGELPQKDGKAYLRGLERLGLNISKLTATFNNVTGRLSIQQGVGTRGLTLEDVIRLVDFQPTVQ